MAETLSALEKALQLTDDTPSDTDILFPNYTKEYELLDGSKITFNVVPWGLGRFVQAQSELGSILVSFSTTFEGITLDKLGGPGSTAVFMQLMTMIMPHIQAVLLITLGADGTFESDEDRPKNMRRFVDNLPLEAAVHIALIVLKQNWRHIKNVLDLAEVKAVMSATLAGASSS